MKVHHRLNRMGTTHILLIPRRTTLSVPVFPLEDDATPADEVVVAADLAAAEAVSEVVRFPLGVDSAAIST